MRNSVRKATARDIRRAFGKDAVEAIAEIGKATVKLGEQLALDHKHNDDSFRRVHNRVNAIENDSFAIRKDVDLLQNVTDRGFFGRFKWLLTGR